ncbi:MAG: UDP-glucose 4-epimerase GalE [Alphaproteobacteria bacterium]|nr:UDP-glucose 4-epimerase GalE [Alphaproteobacteria bacterium]
MSVLVTGGAGYIGSHMTYALLERGEDVVVLDNLSTGSRSLVAEKAAFVEGDVGDRDLVVRLIDEHRVDAVIHFAGSIVVPDSVSDPLTYYANNTVNSRSLIEATVQGGVGNFIFSSTATVYAGQSAEPLIETMQTGPMSPYGRSKLMTEWMLEDAARAHGLRSVVLRYFNVAGADPKGRTGQISPRATHLIKRASQAALGRIPHLDIFGTDYPTADGTGVRDYIHVSDLVSAHALALNYLRAGGESTVMNCGYGHGASVREVIAATERVTGHVLPVREGPRRAGDPPWLIAESSRIRALLGWQPEHDDLEEIVRTAWQWESRLNAS